jgi:hypothetical protein
MRETRRKAFVRALKKLQAQGIVRVCGLYAWRTWDDGTCPDTQRDMFNPHPGHTGTHRPPQRGDPAMSRIMSPWAATLSRPTAIRSMMHRGRAANDHSPRS